MKNFLPPLYKIDEKTQKKEKTKIAVAVSGGVDSSVVVALLKEKGYEVFGMYFKTYKPDGDRTHCQKEGNDAKEICNFLNIPFFVVDLQEEYKNEVFQYMIDFYKKGLTPNPDIFCNKKIKFGHFLEKAKEKGADFVATGHYAKHFFEENYKKNYKKHFLVKAKDQEKDQTYFLSQINQKALAKSIFPLGQFEKKDVRKMAEKYRLFTAEKKDSQGICFIQKEVKIKDFLSEFIEKKTGDILNIDREKIGEHDGVTFFTIGQRHGFEIFPRKKTPNQEKLFIIKKDFQKNTITVAGKKYLEKVKNNLEKNEIFMKNFNFISGDNFEKNKEYFGRIRHRGELISCKIENLENFSEEKKLKKIKENKNNLENQEEVKGLKKKIEKKYKVIFSRPQKAVAKGQFLAIYENDICLGSGEIF